MAPSRMITMEITHARTGRSMKKRASKAGLLSGFFGLPGVCSERDRHVHGLRLDRDARPHLLQAAYDHPLARFQAGGDLAGRRGYAPSRTGRETTSFFGLTM